MSLYKHIFLSILIVALLTGCVEVASAPEQYPTYDPFLPLPANAGGTPLPSLTGAETSGSLTATREPTPTRAPLSVLIPPTPIPGITGEALENTPTPDVAHALPTLRPDAEQYVVQAGDTLGRIAQGYGISVNTLMEANSISDPNMLTVGMTLNIPAPSPVGSGSDFKIIPDSELVYGPASAYFDIQNFVSSQSGYIKDYSQDVNGVTLTSAEIVQTVAQNYSVNPRLLLALLEYQSGWLTNPAPLNTSYPMGLLDENRYGLYRQLAWTANTLNQGYYGWKANALATYVMSDGSVAPISPTINAGTAAVQYFFAKLDDRATWEKDVSGTGALLTYFVHFGNPFDYTIEPLIPSSVAQPSMHLPFSAGELWYFTGGPHGGWDSGSAWAALDFAPPGDNASCAASYYWATAVADGLILRAGNGAVLQDLDNDGYEQTGWVVLYMHVAAEERVNSGDYLYAGDHVGHPSCEGGISNATHLHLARKYNGEWIAAAGQLPFNLDGWIASGNGTEYDGFLTRGVANIEALDSANDANQVYR